VKDRKPAWIVQNEEGSANGATNLVSRSLGPACPKYQDLGTIVVSSPRKYFPRTRTTCPHLGEYALGLVVRLQLENVASIGLGITAVDRVEFLP